MTATYLHIPENILLDDAISMQKDLEMRMREEVKKHPNHVVDFCDIGYHRDDFINNNITVRIHFKPKDSI